MLTMKHLEINASETFMKSLDQAQRSEQDVFEFYQFFEANGWQLLIEFIRELLESSENKFSAASNIMETLIFLVKTVTIKKYHEVPQETSNRKPFAKILKSSLQEKANQPMSQQEKGAKEVDVEVKKLVASSIFSRRQKLEIVMNPHIPLAIGLVCHTCKSFEDAEKLKIIKMVFETVRLISNYIKKIWGKEAEYEKVSQFFFEYRVFDVLLSGTVHL